MTPRRLVLIAAGLAVAVPALATFLARRYLPTPDPVHDWYRERLDAGDVTVGGLRVDDDFPKFATGGIVRPPTQSDGFLVGEDRYEQERRADITARAKLTLGHPHLPPHLLERAQRATDRLREEGR